MPIEKGAIRIKFPLQQVSSFIVYPERSLDNSRPHIHSATLSFNKDILSACCIPDTVLGNVNVAVNKADKNSCSHEGRSKQEFKTNKEHSNRGYVEKGSRERNREGLLRREKGGGVVAVVFL